TYSINNSTIIDLPITVSPFTISIDNVSVNQTLSVITVSNPTFGCSLDYNDNYTVIVHPNIAANVSVTADQTTICQGNTAQFTAISNNGNSVPSYQWQVNGLNVGTNNSTFSWSNLNNGDQVSVVLSLTGGFCLVDDLDTSDVVVMIVNPTPAQPIVSVQNNCGNSLLTASGYTGSLTWNTSEVTPSITANSAGSYTVYQTVNGCESNSASATAAPKLIPSVQLGNDTTICTGSSVTLDAGNTGSTYSWTPSGSTSQTYAYSSSTAGSQIISVQVTAPNSCSNTDNVMITVESCAGVDEYLADFYLKVYPNPSNGIFYISHDDNVTINQIDVYSEDGKLIQTISSQINDMIDLQDVARGVYFVKILMEEGEYLERVIVD
ncbi:MAG: T9SS type A sorting domain-containing protein, partial [Flavobacteriia bacterium]